MTAISTQGLSKHYGTEKALDNLTMDVPDNAVFGFLGPNGAGKTTTVKLLTGFARPTAGRALVAGEEIRNGNLTLQAKIGFLPDVPAYYDWMSGREFLQLVAELHQLPRNGTGRRIDELLDLVDLRKASERRIGGYSRGMRQRLGIAQALINHPKVLFLDEPTSALDPIGRREVLDLILRLKETTTIFMSSHILTDVERVCDMVGIIDKGRLVTVSSVDALQQKYARSVFHMEFLEDARPFVEALKQVPWLADPVIINEGGAPVLCVRGIEVNRAKRELPGLISESGLTLTHYDFGMPSIEDIFMEIFERGDVR